MVLSQVARDLTLREILFKSEMEATKLDNSRLLRLLFSTEEYRRFSKHWDETNGAHYLPPPGVMAASYDNNSKTAGSSAAAPRSVAWMQLEKLADIYPVDEELVEETKKEMMSWVPSKATWLMKEFWIKTCPHVPSHVINKLILDVNEVWQKKEDRRLARLRERYDHSGIIKRHSPSSVTTSQASKDMF